MRIFSHIKENCLKGYVVMSIMMVILVIILQITILQTLFSREKYMIQKELYETTLWCIGYWSGKRSGSSGWNCAEFRIYWKNS